MKTEIELEELKRLQIDILQSVHDFCVEHQLKYSLGFGTLLGAIRHKGYIPWDDDIDILMPRIDYEKFVAAYTHKFYKVYDYRIDPDYEMPYAKVADTRTLLMENVNTKNIGINIDVFPLDPLLDTKDESFAFMKSLVPLKLKFRMKLVRPSVKNVWWKRIAINLSKVLVMHVSLNKLSEELNQRIAKLGNKETNYVGTPADCDPYAIKSIYEKELFEEYILTPFENRMFYIPSGYDRLLRNYYGDYMQLPPINERESPHTLNRIYWIDK